MLKLANLICLFVLVSLATSKSIDSGEKDINESIVSSELERMNNILKYLFKLLSYVNSWN